MAELPAFDRPPVEEVALAVYFEPEDALRPYHVGGLRQRWGDDYSEIEELPELAPPAHPVQGPSGAPQILLEVVGNPFGRYWFRNQTGSLIIQLQKDRLVHNWRRTGPGDDYPHYDELRPRFEQALSNLEGFLADEGLAALSFTQCEVTYVNTIPFEGPLTTASDVARLISPWDGTFSDDFFADRRVIVNLQLRVRIVDDHDEPIGHVGMQFAPVRRTDSKAEQFLLNVQANCVVPDSGHESVMTMLDLCHEQVVRSFASATTPEMHAHWRRTR